MTDDFQLPSNPPWYYVEEGPFAVISMDWGKPRSLHRFDSLRDAVARFVRFHIGPIDGRTVAVLDSNVQIILGYNADRDDQIVWLGTARGYDEFARRANPAAVSVWAASASAADPDIDVPVEAP